MATRQLKVLTEQGTHEIGNLNSLKVKTVAHGAIIEGADVDNFTLVELGFNADGERTAKQLSAAGNKAYLIASPEVRNMGEELVDFYNAIGDDARIVVLEENYTRFDSSAYSLDPGDAAATPARAAVTEVNNGQVAHFDITSKKYIVSASATPHPGYAGSSAKFLVVSNEEDLEYTCGKALVRLEVIEA
jgi:hypothetical protein